MTTTRRYEFSYFTFNIFYLENAKVVSSTFQIHSLNELTREFRIITQTKCPLMKLSSTEIIAMGNKNL